VSVGTPEPSRASKRGRGRPRLLRSGSAGRPRKIYPSAANGEEEDSEQSEDDEVFTECNLTTAHDPITWQEAKQSDDVEAWRTALEDEYLAQIRNKTWEIVSRPKNRKVISNRFVFCTKENGLAMKRKVRLVARGCSQRPGEDFHETYSPVASSTSI